DILILTKPIGTGVIMAGARLNMSTDADVDEAKAQMKLLNRSGASVMKKFGIRGATDVTGFGLAGHALRMARASRVTVSLSMKAVPLIGNAWSLMDAGCIPGASFRNLEYADPDTDFSDDLDYNLRMLAFDAQTSGGLLISAPRDRAEDLLGDLLSSGLQQAAIIGEVKDPGRKLLVIGN
nr:selenide, water dikinase SelD [Bacteroidales bacterium]